MCGGIENRIRQSRFKRNLLDTIECKCFAGEFDIVLNVLPFANQLVGTHDESRHIKGDKAAGYDIGQRRHRNGHTQITNPPGTRIGQGDNGAQQ